MCARLVWLSFLCALAVGGPAWAQDEGLDALLFARALTSDIDGESTVQVRTLQLYRIPLSVRLRPRHDTGWGIRLTFPVSLSGVEIKRVSDLGPFRKSLGIVAVVPGIELEIPVGERLLLRPFAEAGLGRGVAEGRTEVLYGTGLRVRVNRPVRSLVVTYGGNALYRRRAKAVNEYGAYSALEGGVDAQLPLGFSVRQRQARGGVYAIARGFDGLELRRDGHEVIALRRQFETGLSFSTAPDLRVWKVRLPWLAAGYQFSSAVSGVRFYASFPF